MTSEPDLTMQLERIITAPHDARSAVRNLLGDVADEVFWNDSLLATSEVVSHSLTHGTGSARLSAWYSPAAGWLRVEVSDSSGELPELGPGASPDMGHPELGELLLAVLGKVPAAWGIERTPFGRIVWFEAQAPVSSST